MFVKTGIEALSAVGLLAPACHCNQIQCATFRQRSELTPELVAGYLWQADIEQRDVRSYAGSKSPTRFPGRRLLLF